MCGIGTTLIEAMHAGRDATEPERLAFWLRRLQGEAGFGDEAVE